MLLFLLYDGHGRNCDVRDYAHRRDAHGRNCDVRDCAHRRDARGHTLGSHDLVLQLHDYELVKRFEYYSI